MAELYALQKSCNICDRCGKYLGSDSLLCQDCRRQEPAFTICRAVGPYKEANRIVIKILKFLGKKSVSYTMGALMAEVVKNEKRYWPLDMIVPVPSSYRSMVQRGFSQTLLLSQPIGKILEIKNVDKNCLLRDQKNAPLQKELTREERIRNLRGAFYVKYPDKVAGKNILLVDDIYTTGSTVKECSKILLAAGAAKVAVITWSSGVGL
jgi:ComF family protein